MGIIDIIKTALGLASDADIKDMPLVEQLAVLNDDYDSRKPKPAPTVEDTVAALEAHLKSEANLGLQSASYVIADPSLCKSVFAAAKKWKGCQATCENGCIKVKW